MADEIEPDETIDEEDLAEGFDESGLDEEEPDGEELEDEEESEGEDFDDDADADEETATEEEPVAEAEPAPVDDEDDLALDHDVELALDEVLAETMRLTTDVDEDDDAAPEPEDKGELGESVLPKQDDEFRCRSCRLLKKMSQLADRDRMFCRDCV